ncbi:MAG: M48 family metallopeptidase [Oscillospiraceae bacterium]|nr:M48 family metallopeptidase [Oscillospiraceae bacterium]
MRCEEATYRVIRSDRKTIAIQIMPDGEVVVRAPVRMPTAAIEGFVQNKASWIEKQLARLPVVDQLTEAQMRELVKKAKAVIPEKVAYFASLVGVDYGRVSIRAQHSRWGSCSGKGNLNFNCLLMLAPPEVVDYVVIHELCHRKEMNHSQRFWLEVERVLPNYRASKKWLKDNGQNLIGRLQKR